jgi:DNA repair ATPase RecN
MPVSTANDLLIDSHEKRLQNVEQSLNECVAEVAKNSAKMEEVGEKIKLSGENVAEKIETLVKSMDRQFEAHADLFKAQADAMKALADQVQKNTSDITVFKKIEGGRQDRKNWWRKIATAVITLVAGGLATKGLALVLAHFGVAF